MKVGVVKVRETSDHYVLVFPDQSTRTFSKRAWTLQDVRQFRNGYVYAHNKLGK